MRALRTPNKGDLPAFIFEKKKRLQNDYIGNRQTNAKEEQKENVADIKKKKKHVDEWKAHTTQ